MELVASGFVFPHFQVMSNELSTPKILVCPADKNRTFKAKFTSDLRDANLSYFVNVDAVEGTSSSLLCGDRNLTNKPSARSRFVRVSSTRSSAGPRTSTGSKETSASRTEVCRRSLTAQFRPTVRLLRASPTAWRFRRHAQIAFTNRVTNLLYPTIRRALLPAIVRYAVRGAMLAGCYGVVHDQVTYSISPEYFTRLKFVQFHYADFGLPPRVFVAEIGFLATWWVGMIAGWFIARVTVPGYSRPEALRRCARGFLIVFASALVAALTGYVLGLLHGSDYSAWEDLASSLGISEPVVLCAGRLHSQRKLSWRLNRSDRRDHSPAQTKAVQPNHPPSRFARSRAINAAPAFA